MPLGDSIAANLSDCPWYGMPPMKRPWWAQQDCAGPRMIETNVGVMCEEHYNAQPTATEGPVTPVIETILNYLVCEECGEAFDGIMTATAHEFQQHGAQTLDGDHVTYTIKAESEAL